MLKYILLIWFYGSAILAAQTNIFECVRSDGSKSFQDKPCKVVYEHQTAHNIYIQPVNNEEALEMERMLERHRQAIAKTRVRMLRRKITEKKRLELEEKQRLRLHAKCERVQQQMVELQRRYRQGYNAKQGTVLDRKMAECKLKEQKYCHDE